MNKAQAQVRAKYATACNMAKIEGKNKPDWEEWKKQYNYYGTTNIIELHPNTRQNKLDTPTHNTTQIIKDNARRQEKALKQINITMHNVLQQMDILDDFFKDLSDKHPEYKTYHKLSDYIMGSIYDISEKLQTL